MDIRINDKFFRKLIQFDTDGIITQVTNIRTSTHTHQTIVEFIQINKQKVVTYEGQLPLQDFLTIYEPINNLNHTINQEIKRLKTLNKTINNILPDLL